MRHLVRLAALAAVAVVLPAADPFLGTWKLNVEKSRTTLKPPPPPPRSLLVTNSRQGEARKISTVVILADGKTRTAEHIIFHDGKDHPRATDAAPGDTMATTRIDEYTEESVMKRDGRVTVTTRRVVSPDGKTMTATSQSKGPDGQPAETVSVYDKQ